MAGLLSGKVCLVTGASRGIGAATIKKFAEEGARVYADFRQCGEGDEVCSELSKKNDTVVRALYFDVRDEEAVKKAFNQVRKEEGKLDVLVNNAGVMKDYLIGMISKELMQDLFETNVYATINMLQMAAKIMMYQKKGSIINLSSIVGLEGNPGQLVYSATKGAVVSITKTAAKELAQHGIRVNAVAPGMIDTDMFRSIGEDKVDKYIDRIGFKRLGQPEEVADAILYLASDLSEYVTGEILGVNGGVII